MFYKIILFLLLEYFGLLSGLNNGLTRTPPMGWLSWERFRCTIDCTNYPNDCISEQLFVDMANHMAADGFLSAGYQYIIIDDCWMDHKRDSMGRLQPDPSRFPHGIKWLADYIHAKGLKFGIYGDFGTYTCAGYPGSEYYLQIDAETFAEWGVDYFKMDGCYSNINQFDDAYPAMGYYLNRTGRPIVYSCSWPAYQEGSVVPNYKKIAENCNLWRNYDDIDDSWASVYSIINFYGNDKTNFTQVAGPGNFNDPDMLIIGNFGLSFEQEKSQMALWCLMASPLIMSNDLRQIRNSSKQLLVNKYAIAINQDSLGIQGKRILSIGNIQIWTKIINPTNSYAFVFFNTFNAMPQTVSIKLEQMGLNNTAGYKLYEVFSNLPFDGTYLPSSNFTALVNPNGVFFGKAIAL